MIIILIVNIIRIYIYCCFDDSTIWGWTAMVDDDGWATVATGVANSADLQVKGEAA